MSQTKALERRVRLKPEEWARVAWRWSGPLPVEIKPFDRERSAKALGDTLGVWNVVRNIRPAPRVSREEAAFWIAVFSRAWTSGTQAALQFGFDAADAPPSGDELWARLTSGTSLTWFWPHGLPMLLAFFEPEQVADRVLGRPAQERAAMVDGVIEAFGRNVGPYADEARRARFRAHMTKRLGQASDISERMMAAGMLAAVGGGAALKGFFDAHLGEMRHLATIVLKIAVGLSDEQAFGEVIERGGIVPKDEDDLRLWLAATEWRRLPATVGCVTDAPSRDEARSRARVLSLVEAPEAAGVMLTLKRESKAPDIAVEWFQTNPEWTAAALVLEGRAGGVRGQAALEQLRALKRLGWVDAMRVGAERVPPEDQAWFHEHVGDWQDEELPDIPESELPPSLREALAAAAKAFAKVKVPGWTGAAPLPPLKRDGRRLSGPAVDRLLRVLIKTPLGEAAPVVREVKAQCERHSVDAFAWRLFELWEENGAPSKERWAVAALGHLGGDDVVLKLTPLIRKWPGESQHKRALLGLECLQAIGTDAALMALNGIALKVKFKALKDAAQSMMEGIAKARGLSREELADRIVPDCDLDERGSRIFDFGPRQFAFVLGPEMKPMVRDGAGKVRPDLPPPNSSDDPVKAEAAVAAWKLLKKTLRDVLKVQADRLEEVMVTGRLWSVADFETLVVKHPLLVNLARQLVFGAHDQEGRLVGTFRVTEDQSYADARDDAIALPTDGRVAVVHPAHLDEAARSAWGELLSDYGIIPPFQQLGRNVVRPDPEDEAATTITRFKAAKVEAIVVYGILERSNWRRDSPADGGGFAQHSKYFEAADVTAFVHYDPPLSIGYYEGEVCVDEVYFVKGRVDPDSWGTHRDRRMPVGDVDRVVVSEVLRLVHAIVAKQKEGA